MVLKVYAIFDSKAGAYLQPFFCVNRAVALRTFMSAVQDRGSDFHRYAGDYQLFELGEWDQVHGVFEQHETKVALGLASEFLARAGDN